MAYLDSGSSSTSSFENCDWSDGRQIFGIVGDSIIPWEKYVNIGFNGDTTPDVFLEASCESSGDETVDFTSFSDTSSSNDFNNVNKHWVLIPTKFSGSLSSVDGIFDEAP